MNDNQIIKTKEVLIQQFKLIKATFDYKEGFYIISQFIKFIDNNSILQTIVLAEKEKFEQGGLEKENLYKDYLYISDSLRLLNFTDYPKIYYSSIDLYSKLLNLLYITDSGKHSDPIFDPETKLLYIQDEKPININKQAKISNQYLLLKYIFEQKLGCKIFYDEILEKVFDFNDKITKCISACRDINNNIFKKTDYRIDNFLEYSKSIKGYVKINSKYLSPN